jgi:RNA recognition motif-containing protein
MFRKAWTPTPTPKWEELSTTCLQVKNVPANTTVSDLKELFGNYGSVFFIRLHATYYWENGFHEDSEWNPHSDYTNVTAFVTMRDAPAESARKALDGRHWHGRRLHVDTNAWLR